MNRRDFLTATALWMFGPNLPAEPSFVARNLYAGWTVNLVAGPDRPQDAFFHGGKTVHYINPKVVRGEW